MDALDTRFAWKYFLGAVVAIVVVTVFAFWWGENHPELLHPAPVYTHR